MDMLHTWVPQLVSRFVKVPALADLVQDVADLGLRAHALHVQLVARQPDLRRSKSRFELRRHRLPAVGLARASLTHLQAECGLEGLVGHLGGELLDDCLVRLVLRDDVDRRRLEGACNDHKRKNRCLVFHLSSRTDRRTDG